MILDSVQNEITIVAIESFVDVIGQYFNHLLWLGCRWVVAGTGVERIAATIGAFPEERHADLWSGVGLACAYAGGATRSSIGKLRKLAGARSSELALGAAFAAKTRQRAGNPAPHTETAAAVLCGMTAAAAAAITDECLEDLGPRGSEPAYEVWRARIRERFGP